MSAPFLLAVFDSVYILALTAWVGSILFLSFGVAPIIFSTLGEEAGGKFVRAPLPTILRLGCDIRGDRLAGLYVRAPELPGVSWADGRGPGAGAAGRHADHALRGELADPGDQCRARRRPRRSGARFARLHRRSVRLNVVALGIGVGLLLAFVNRPRPDVGNRRTVASRTRRAAYEPSASPTAPARNLPSKP